MKRIFSCNLLLFCVLFVVPTTCFAAAPTVFVSILPQKFFVQQIGGDNFHIEVMVQPGASPHTYEPKPSQMRKLADARTFFTIGVALEDAWLDKISTINPDMNVVHTEAGISKMKMAVEHGHDDEHGHADDDDDHNGHGDSHGESEGEHDDHDDDTGLDPHIWLAPALVKIQVKTIVDSLAQLDPDNARHYQENYNKFITRIDELDRRLQSILAEKAGTRFMVFHPSWGYFADSYGLEQIPVEIEGKSPKPAQLKKLIDEAKEQQITVLFAQPQLSRKSAEMIAREIDGEVVLIDPLAEDWFANMSSVADTLSSALR